VRSESEILSTLDADGRRNGLPFMPEMLQFVGLRFRVLARADKTCDTITKTGGRRMRNTVHLETRCDGSAHGGCQARCLIYWNEVWLRRVDDGASGVVTAGRGASALCTRERLQQATRDAVPAGATSTEDVRYRCQATELLGATSPLAWWDPRQYWRDWRSGNVRIGWMLRVFATAAFNALQRWRGGGRTFPRMAEPTLTKTPVEVLDLQPGELVQIKTAEEIAKTLNVHSRNRGLWFDAEMVPYCGGTFRVEQRVEQIIDERTRQMLRFPTACIMLEGVVCRSQYSSRRLFCPRRITPYWREIWLRRTAAQAAPAPRSAPDASGVDAPDLLLSGEGMSSRS
jgi:hypothetical protein